MKKAVQRFLPSREQVKSSSSSLKRSLKIDNINLIQDFYIELSEPHRTWSPGDSVTGIAVLDLKKNIMNINLTLSIVGYIKIKQSTASAAVRSKPTVLFKHTTVIYGHDPNETSRDNGEDEDEPTAGLSKGEHRFPFSMKLPKKNIYTSIAFEKGSIQYSLRASINHNQAASPSSSLNNSPASSSTLSNIVPSPFNSIQHCEKNIQVVVPINVARLPKPQPKVALMKVSDKKLKKTLSSTSTVNSNLTQHTCASDQSYDSSEGNHNEAPSSSASSYSYPVKLIVDLPQSGYLRGEIIPVKIKVMHYKAVQSSNGLIVTLARICRVDNDPESPIQSFRKDLCQTIAPLYIDPETLSCEVSTSLKVPIDAFPTIVGSKIVTFQYYIEVLANLSNRSLLPNGNQKTPTPSKFSHSLVFDLDSSHERNFTDSETSMINVDKLKRTKNLLGLNTEIIVGTERKVKEKINVGKKTIISHVQRVDGVIPTEAGNNASAGEDISLTSISPLSIDAVNVSAPIEDNSESIGEEFPLVSVPEELSEKERLRLQEEALLPSEPISYDIAPAPSYSATRGTIHDHNITMTDVPEPATPSSSNPPVPEFPTEDKAELENRRLQDMESEPPEFDYVPQYSDSPSGSNLLYTQQSTSSSGTFVMGSIPLPPSHPNGLET